MTYRLIGVGVGPGDPELLTLKALATLRGADVILVPQTEASGDGPGRAESIVLAADPTLAGAIRRIPFSMADRSGVTPQRATSWRQSAQAALDAFDAGARTVAAATIGDPSVYSTFSYLAATVCQARPEVNVDVIPGITAMQALAAASRVPLAEGDEVLALVPFKGDTDKLTSVRAVADTCVIYKAGRYLDAIRETLGEESSRAIVASNVTLPDESIVTLDDHASAPYFTSVLIPPHRDGIGGRI